MDFKSGFTYSRLLIFLFIYRKLRVSSLLQTSLGTRPPTAQRQVTEQRLSKVALLYPFAML